MYVCMFVCLFACLYLYINDIIARLRTIVEYCSDPYIGMNVPGGLGFLV